MGWILAAGTHWSSRGNEAGDRLPAAIRKNCSTHSISCRLAVTASLPRLLQCLVLGHATPKGEHIRPGTLTRLSGGWEEILLQFRRLGENGRRLLSPSHRFDGSFRPA